MQEETKDNGEITLNDLAIMVKEGFDAVDKRFEGVEQRLGGVEQRLGGMERTLTTLATRDYLDRAVANVKGDLIAKAKKGDEKVNLLIQSHKENGTLTGPQIEALHEVEVFPRLKV